MNTTAPHDLDAERGLVGALIGPFSSHAIPVAAALLRTEDLYSPACQNIFAAALALHAQGSVSDPVTVAGRLRAEGLFEETGGGAELIALQANSIPPTSVPHYAAIIRGHAQRRAWGTIAENLREACRLGDEGQANRALSQLHEALTTPAAVTAKVLDGAAFVLDAPNEVAAVWGRGNAVLWPEGESVLMVGPAGVGKTTVIQQVVLARMGLRPQVLDLAVAEDDRPVMYIAADRPRQASRSLWRMVDEGDREILRRQLKVWKGPLPFDIGQQPEALLRLAEHHGAGTVILDSLKDVALDLVKDDVGARVNLALQLLVDAGIEVTAIHHQRKGQGAAEPKTMADVYGSTWLTAGAGSVVLLWGEAGDPVVTLKHLKQPAEMVGPLTLLQDQTTGTTTVLEEPDAFALVYAAPGGLTAQEVAMRLFSKANPKPNDVEKARRRLDALVRDQKLHKDEGARGGGQQRQVTRYHAIERLRSAP